MSRISPTLEGFRAAYRRPSLTFAEITWRWVVGATATALFFFGLFEYLNTLPVTRGEMLFLRTRQPYLVAQAILHVLRGGLSRAVVSVMVAALLIALVWVIAGSLGRIATVRALLEYFRERLSASAHRETSAVRNERPGRSASGRESNSLHSLISLHFFRAGIALAAMFGLMGAGILASFISPDANPRPGLAFLCFLPLAGLVCFFWWALNWLLSFAPVFAVRDHEDSLGAISMAVALLRERTGAVLAVSSWVGLAHLVVFVGATTAVSVPMGLMPLVPWRLAALAMIVVTLGYFALADWLYMARLAGFVCIAEMPEEMFAPSIPVPPALTPLLQTSIDRSELILSDVPYPAMESFSV
jgi:hypothetical protein